MTSTAPYRARAKRRGRLSLGPIRLDLFILGTPPWWLPMDRR